MLKLASFYLIVFNLFLMQKALAFGPVGNMAHLSYEELGLTVRISLQMNYWEAMTIAKIDKPARSHDEFQFDHLPKIFKATIGKSPIMMNEQPCSWTIPRGLHSKTMMQMQVVASCPEHSVNLYWDLGYLTDLSEDKFIVLDAVFADNTKTTEMITPLEPYFQRNNQVFLTHLEAGMLFLLTHSSGWLLLLLIAALIHSGRREIEAAYWIGFTLICFALVFSLDLTIEQRRPLDLMVGASAIMICFCSSYLIVPPNKYFQWQWIGVAVAGIGGGMIAANEFGNASAIDTPIARFGFMTAIFGWALFMLVIWLPWKDRLSSRWGNLSMNCLLGIATLLALT